MNIKSLLISLTLVLVYSFSNAQRLKLSDKPEEFLADAKNFLALSNNSQAEQIAQNFDKLWNAGKLTDAQKSKLASVSNFMFKKGYKPPHFVGLFDAVILGVNNALMPQTLLDNYLETLRESIETGDTKTTLRYIDISRLYFNNRAIYFTNFNRLYAQNGSIGFKFNDQKIETNKPEKPVTTNQPTTTTPGIEKKTNAWEDWDAPLPTASNAPAQAPVEEPAMQFLNPGPVIEFNKIDLIIATANDSVTLKNTSAILSIKEGILLGTGGNFSWENVGMPEVFATLNNYNMEIRNPKITSEFATITNNQKLNGPIKGIFEFQSKKRTKNAQTFYPRFMSLENDVILKNSVDIDYKGGFTMVGNKISSSSLQSKYATIVIKKDGKIAFRITSKRFEIGDSLIISPSAIFTGYFAGSDSLYHPSVKLNYNRKNSILRLNKVDAGGFRESSYSDSYHKLDITADAMSWNMNDQRMDFSILTAKNVVPALFESFDYYNPERFAQISANYSFNPLLVVSNYIRKNNLPSTTLTDIAKAFNKDATALRPVFLEMMQKGYFEYDPDVETLKLSRKGMHNLAAYGARKDYDNFLIPSYYSSNTKDTTSNASLNLKDNQLIVRGVKQFYLSDSLNVFMAPYDNIIKVNKDRNFGISGELKTGNFRFRGKDLSFNYGEFSVKLNKIDSITFVPQKELSKKGRIEIGGDLKYEAGVIYINKPDNKSGRQRLVEYPRLVVPTGVTAYFDHPYRANGVYNKKIFFKVPSIDFDSLNIKDIDFVGTFNSDGIFPPFKETLISMPDNSLGFSHKVTDGKYNVYNSKTFVKFEKPLLMDKQGLHAECEINHLTSQIQAKYALFTIDSVTANGTTGIINEGTVGQSYYTKVDIKNYSLKWQPKSDSMLIETKGNSFDFYAASSKLEGKLLVRQTGLFGFGKVKRQDSETESNNIKFGKEAFTADMATLSVGNNLKVSKPALLGNNMNVSFNLATGLVSIKTPTNLKLDDSTSLYFPYTAYRTSINSAEWDINKKTITMKGDVKNTTFTSIEPSQEGLSFNGSEALYEIDKQSLNITGVPFIKSADAKIIPDKGAVSIRRDAEMRGFYNAKLQIDTVNGYHNLVNGNIRIISRIKFEGDATYRFPNLAGDTMNVKMGNFDFKESIVDGRKKIKGYTTTAKATVEQTDKFHLSSKILYRGDITMVATDKNLMLNGFVRPEYKNRADVVNWVAYKGNSTNDVNIQIQANMKGDLNTPIYAGLHARTTSTGLYTTFLTSKEDPKDEDIFTVNGQLRDIPKTSRFEIGPDDKNKSYEASRYTYDDDKRTLKLEGNFNFYNPSSYIQTAGFAEMRVDSGKYKFDQMMVLNFPMPIEVLKAMADKIVKTNLDSRDNASADEPEDKEHLISKLANILGGKTIDASERRLKNEHVPLHTINAKLNTTMVISKANLRYSEQASSFYSVGKLSIASIGGTDINSEIEGMVEIKKTPEGDEFYLYLEPSTDVWYFMGYLKNEMGVISSDGEFNNAVSAKSKGVKKGSGKNAYVFLGVGAEEKFAFTEHFTDTFRTKTEKGKKVVKKDELKKEEKKKEEVKEGF
jgi:spore coat protein U-like protein